MWCGQDWLTGSKCPHGKNASPPVAFTVRTPGRSHLIGTDFKFPCLLTPHTLSHAPWVVLSSFSSGANLHIGSDTGVESSESMDIPMEPAVTYRAEKLCHAAADAKRCASGHSCNRQCSQRRPAGPQNPGCLKCVASAEDVGLPGERLCNSDPWEVQLDSGHSMTVFNYCCTCC